jgi:hypothetical protein
MVNEVISSRSASAVSDCPNGGSSIRPASCRSRRVMLSVRRFARWP